MSKALNKLSALLSEIKTSGTHSVIGDRVPLIFTPSSNPLVLNMNHPAVASYSAEMVSLYPEPGLVAAHLGKVAAGGKPVSMNVMSPPGLKIQDVVPLTVNQDDRSSLYWLTERLNNVVTKVDFGPTTSSVACTLAQLAAFQEAVVNEFSEAIVYTIGSFDAPAGSLATLINASPLCLPTPGHFTVVLVDSPGNSTGYGTSREPGLIPIRVLKIPTTVDTSVWYGAIIGPWTVAEYKNGKYGYVNLALRPLRREVAVAGPSMTITQMTPNRDNSSGGFNFCSVKRATSLAGVDIGAYLCLKAGWNLVSDDRMSFEHMGADGSVGVPLSLVPSSATGLVNPRYAEVAALSALTSDQVAAEALMNNGWVKIGRDYATNHVVSDVFIDWEPSMGQQTSAISVRSNVSFGRLADKLSAAFQSNTEVSGVVARLRKDPTGIFHCYSTPGKLVRPMSDPLYRTKIYDTANEAGEDIRGTNMIESDPDDVTSMPTTFSQANLQVMKYKDGLQSFYASSSPLQQTTVRTTEVLFVMKTGAPVAVDVKGQNLDLDELYVLLSVLPLSKVNFTEEARAFFDALANPAVMPSAYPVVMDKMATYLYAATYGAITVASSTGLAANKDWAAELEYGFIVSPDRWTPEYWMTWGAGKAQEVKTLVSGVMSNPQGLGITIANQQ